MANEVVYAELSTERIREMKNTLEFHLRHVDPEPTAKVKMTIKKANEMLKTLNLELFNRLVGVFCDD